MMDPRMFLGIGGPTPQQQMLPPGFRPPGPAPGAPMGGPPQGQQMGVPGMGGMGGMGALAGMFGPRPSTSGAEMGAAENNGLAAAVSGIAGIQPNAAGGFTPPLMPTDIGSGGGGMGGGSFMSWLRGLF
jgi:hypothetical protein